MSIIILDTLYVHRVFVGYIFIVRYTLLGIGFEANKLLSLRCSKMTGSPKSLYPFGYSYWVVFQCLNPAAFSLYLPCPAAFGLIYRVKT